VTDIERAAKLLQEADGLVIAAGAGMGVDSGLPDFRGNSGFWNAYPALGKAKMSFIDIASPGTFYSNPQLGWGFYGHRLSLYRQTVPHAGFAILLRWAERMPIGAFVVTSNVDGQFQKAGFAAEQVYECHGSIHWLQCLEACSPTVWPADTLTPIIDTEFCQWLDTLPSCSQCGGIARPNVFMFGDGHWLGSRYRRQEERLHKWLRGVKRPAVVELGAGTHIPSVRHFGESVIQRPNSGLVRINPRESEVPNGPNVGLRMGALEGLQAVDSALKQVSA
jgi:NAD-dependent SIR2 family protein deacetylase